MPIRLLNRQTQEPLVDLTNALEKDSREALRVYLNQLDAYKLFTSRQQAVQASMAISQAKAAGLPIARESQPFYEAILEEANGVRTDVFVLQSERHMGHFFQLSKPGHVGTLATTIKGSLPENRRKAIRAFEAARDFGLTDPQGFFVFELGMPIRFFDVHRAANPAPQIQEIIDRLSAQR